ncbi:hypothetical protein AAMO2058_000504700 [Amorphochlora amoebiformis]
MEEGSMDGLGVKDALALAICFGSVVVGGVFWLRRSSRNAPQAHDPIRLELTGGKKDGDLGLQDLEQALKEAEASENRQGGNSAKLQHRSVEPADDDLDLAAKELADMEKLLASNQKNR